MAIVLNVFDKKEDPRYVRWVMKVWKNKKLRFLYAFMAFALFALSWTTVFHDHHGETKAGESCSVCVAGHQISTGAGAVLEKAATPVFLSLHLGPSAFYQAYHILLISQSSRAPPVV